MDKSAINPATGKAWAVNPATGVWDDNYFANVVEPKFRSTSSNSNSTGSSTSGLNPTDILATAQKMQDFYKTQNQPVIAATEATKGPLQERYKNLLDSIKQNQTTAENRQILTTNNELGRRGITGSSGVAQQEITNAVNPVTQQYTQLTKDTTGQENIDLANIDKAIAMLQAGNPESAVSASLNLGNAQQQATQFQQTMAAQEKQRAIENALAELQAKSKTGYQTIAEGASVYDPTTGRIIATAPKTYKDVQNNFNNPLGI